MKRYIQRVVVTIIVILLIWFIIIFFVNKDIIYLSNPFPQHPKIIDWIDDYLRMSANIRWYEVKEKSTGEKYLIWVKNSREIRIMDNEKRDKYIIINKDEYLKRFEQPVFGKGLF